jgi:hypothetical protein
VDQGDSVTAGQLLAELDPTQRADYERWLGQAGLATPPGSGTPGPAGSRDTPRPAARGAELARLGAPEAGAASPSPSALAAA